MTDPNTPPAPAWFMRRYTDKEQAMISEHEQVVAPTHYDVWEDTTAIEVMARTSSVAEFNGFCRNTALKYRLRAGKKADALKDLHKAEQYRKLFDEYKHLCIPDAECEYVPRKNDQ